MGLNIDIKNFYNDWLPSTLSVLYEVPSGHKAAIKSIVLRSENEVEKAMNIQVRRAGKTVTISPEILKELHTWTHNEVEVLEAGDKLLGSTDSGSYIGCKVNGILEKI